YVDTQAGTREAPPLTMAYVERALLPVLNALDAINSVVSHARGNIASPLVLLHLHRTPLTVSLEGADDVIRVVRESVVPWRRKYAQRLAAIEEAERTTEILKQQAEISDIKARTAKTRAEQIKLMAEAYDIRQRAESVWVQN